MKKNMGDTDRIIRFAVAALIVIMYYFNVIEGTQAYILLGLARIFVLTSFINFCPLEIVFGINTYKIKE